MTLILSASLVFFPIDLSCQLSFLSKHFTFKFFASPLVFLLPKAYQMHNIANETISHFKIGQPTYFSSSNKNTSFTIYDHMNSLHKRIRQLKKENQTLGQGKRKDKKMIKTFYLIRDKKQRLETKISFYRRRANHGYISSSRLEILLKEKYHTSQAGRCYHSTLKNLFKRKTFQNFRACISLTILLMT